MKKILTIGLAVLLAVFLGGMIGGGSQLYAISDNGLGGPMLSDSPAVAYHEAPAGDNSYVTSSETLEGPAISTSTAITYQESGAKCNSYARSEVSDVPMISPNATMEAWGGAC